MAAVTYIITGIIRSLILFYRFSLLVYSANRCLIVSPLYYVALFVTCSVGQSGTVLFPFPSHCVLRKGVSETTFTRNFAFWFAKMLEFLVLSRQV